MLGSLNSRMRLLNANDHNKWQWSRLKLKKKTHDFCSVRMSALFHRAAHAATAY